MEERGHHSSHDVVLEDGNILSDKYDQMYVYVLDIDPPFSPRIVIVKKNKSVTDEYELMEILGR
jgi:hypothetical protein